MNNNFQVIVVGAGPAGSTLAYELAIRGIRVLVLEKALLPRYKCCAGGLTVKAANLLGINIDDLIDNVVCNAIVTYRGNNHYYGYSNAPFMYTVARETFDHALVKRAQEAGAVILQGVEARTIQINDLGVNVSTSTGSFRSEFVIGADGSGSQVRKAMGIVEHNSYIVGLQMEVQVMPEELVRWKSQIGIDIGLIRGGYCWVFPKADHLTIGVVGPNNKVKGLKNILVEYVNSLKLGQHKILKWTAGLLPVCVGQPVVSQGRAILLGDAAGLADPMTGEGLHNAILSAKLGAAAIDKALTSDNAEISDYSNAVAAVITPQMKIAYVFSKALALLPVQLIRLLEKDERVWQACCSVLRGDSDYVTIRNKIGSLGRLYSLVSHT